MPTGLYGQEFEEEEGLEEEGFLDVVKPYKQRATAYLREKGMPMAADVVDMIGPDSPGDILPTGKGVGMLGMAGKKPPKAIPSLSVPSHAKGDNLPEVQKQMSGLRQKLQDIRNQPPPSDKDMKDFSRQVESIEMIKRNTPERTLWNVAQRSPMKDYPKTQVDDLLKSGKVDEAKQVHDSFKDIGTDHFGLAMYDVKAEKIQRALLEQEVGKQ